MISAERERQITQEGFTPEHDAQHQSGELIAAGNCYAFLGRAQLGKAPVPTELAWPWDDEWWKPSLDPVRNLVRAGALFAAQADRYRAHGDADKAKVMDGIVVKCARDIDSCLWVHPPDVPALDLQVFVDDGYLQEANRRFFHPLGLALEVVTEKGRAVCLGRVWDARKDPQGITYDPGLLSRDKAARVSHEWHLRATTRQWELGQVLQPVDGPPASPEGTTDG